MLQWWESFEPEYWELPQGTKPDQSLAFNGYDPDSPPRRDQFVPLPVIDLTDQTGTSGQIRLLMKLVKWLLILFIPLQRSQNFILESHTYWRHLGFAKINSQLPH